MTTLARFGLIHLCSCLSLVSLPCLSFAQQMSPMEAFLSACPQGALNAYWDHERREGVLVLGSLTHPTDVGFSHQDAFLLVSHRVDLIEEIKRQAISRLRQPQNNGAESIIAACLGHIGAFELRAHELTMASTAQLVTSGRDLRIEVDALRIMEGGPASQSEQATIDTSWNPDAPAPNPRRDGGTFFLTVTGDLPFSLPRLRASTSSQPAEPAQRLFSSPRAGGLDFKWIRSGSPAGLALAQLELDRWFALPPIRNRNCDGCRREAGVVAKAHEFSIGTNEIQIRQIVAIANALFRSGIQDFRAKAREHYEHALVTRPALVAEHSRNWSAEVGARLEASTSARFAVPLELSGRDRANHGATELLHEAHFRIAQIDAGVDWYGYRSNFVPSLGLEALARDLREAHRDLQSLIGRRTNVRDRVDAQTENALMARAESRQANLLSENRRRTVEVAKLSLEQAAVQADAINQRIQNRIHDLSLLQQQRRLQETATGLSATLGQLQSQYIEFQANWSRLTNAIRTGTNAVSTVILSFAAPGNPAAAASAVQSAGQTLEGLVNLSQIDADAEARSRIALLSARLETLRNELATISLDRELNRLAGDIRQDEMDLLRARLEVEKAVTHARIAITDAQAMTEAEQNARRRQRSFESGLFDDASVNRLLELFQDEVNQIAHAFTLRAKFEAEDLAFARDRTEVVEILSQPHRPFPNAGAISPVPVSLNDVGEEFLARLVRVEQILRNNTPRGRNARGDNLDRPYFVKALTFASDSDVFMRLRETGSTDIVVPFAQDDRDNERFRAIDFPGIARDHGGARITSVAVRFKTRSGAPATADAATEQWGQANDPDRRTIVSCNQIRQFDLYLKKPAADVYLPRPPGAPSSVGFRFDGADAPILLRPHHQSQAPIDFERPSDVEYNSWLEKLGPSGTPFLQRSPAGTWILSLGSIAQDQLSCVEALQLVIQYQARNW